MALSKKTTSLLCLAVFVLGVIWFFPLQNLKGLIFKKIFEQTGTILLAEEMRLLFLGWPGVRLKNVTVTIPLGMETIEISSASVDLRLRLSSSFVPSVSLFLDGLSQGGNFFINGGTRGDKLYLNLSSQDLSLSEINFSGLQQKLEGFIKSDVSLKYHDSLFSDTQGKFLISGKKFKTPPFLINNPLLGPPFQIPELKVGPINIDIAIKNGTATLTAFQLGDTQSDLRAKLVGGVQLGSNPMDSRVNLTLKLFFSETIFKNPEYKTFLDFLGAFKTSTPGEFGMIWNARLQEIMNLPLPSPLR